MSPRKKLASEIQVGDRVMPPPRELSLWMRRTARERGLGESALVLTVTEVKEAAPDKRGRWLLVTCDQTAEWIGEGRAFPFKFKARPETAWEMAQEEEEEVTK